MSTTIMFNNLDIRTEVPGIKIVGLSPAIPGKKRNKVEIPGVDYDYDFGNNKKTNFNIDVEFKILKTEVEVEGEDVDYDIWQSFSDLSGYLDYDEAKSFSIDEFTGKAQVYDPITPSYNRAKNSLTGTITFECWED